MPIQKILLMGQVYILNWYKAGFEICETIELSISRNCFNDNQIYENGKFVKAEVVELLVVPVSKC